MLRLTRLGLATALILAISPPDFVHAQDQGPRDQAARQAGQGSNGSGARRKGRAFRRNR